MRLFVPAILSLVLAAAPLAAGAQDAPAPAGPAPSPAAQPAPPAPPLATPAPAAPVRRPEPRPAAQPATPPPAPLASPALVNGARLAVGQAIPQADLEAFIDGVVRAAMARDHIAGVTVAVVQNGQIVLKKGYGFADLSPQRTVDPDRTLFRIGSISKTFTWIALMQQVEAGRIRLDQPINTYLPERLRIRDRGGDQPIRVVNLMDHSAGFEDRALGQLFERDPRRERSLADYLRQERPARVNPPGAVSSYSNYGAALAGAAAAKASGKTFEALVEQRITRPLGLAHTTFREPRPAERGLPAPMPAHLAADLATGYRWTPQGFEARPFELIGHIGPAGAASSTAADMGRYMQLLLAGGALDGVTIYGPASAQAFNTPLRRTPVGVNGWRHGFMAYALPGGHQGFGHPGATLSFYSNLVVSPGLGLGVFVATNTDTGGRLPGDLPRLLVEEFYAPPQPFPRPGSPDLVRYADAFTGDYVSSRRAHGGLEGFVTTLVGQAQVSVTPDGRLLVSTMEGGRLWAPEGEPREGRFIAIDGPERLVFAMRDGRAVSMQDPMGVAVYARAGLAQRPDLLIAAAGLVLLASAATLIGSLMRNRRERRESAVQNRAGLIQATQAVLWPTAMLFLVLWAAGAGDIAKVMWRWPGLELIVASACAFVAAVLTLVSLALAPLVWRGGRRVDSWTAGRKLAFSFTTLIYLGFSALLMGWGALSFWG